MGYVAVEVICFFAGFILAALMSANKCGDCAAERRRCENPSLRTVEDACPYEKATEADDE